MATETETETTTKGSTRRGFSGLACIKCGEADAIRVNVADMTFGCSSCDDEFDAEAVREHLASWARVLDWIELSPAK